MYLPVSNPLGQGAVGQNCDSQFAGASHDTTGFNFAVKEGILHLVHRQRHPQLSQVLVGGAHLLGRIVADADRGNATPFFTFFGQGPALTLFCPQKKIEGPVHLIQGKTASACNRSKLAVRASATDCFEKPPG